MPANPPDNMPRITPNLFYDDPASALEWLAEAFGFETRLSMPGPDGAIMHAEMQVVESVVMMSPTSAIGDWRSPRSLDGSVTQGLYVYVDDVDAHCARARAAGGKIHSEPEDMFWGDRTYVVEDLEGHRWTFAQHTRDVAPEDMKPPA
jgi:uncharacterized glyoxalase superfamily protein PhnB